MRQGSLALATRTCRDVRAEVENGKWTTGVDLATGLGEAERGMTLVCVVALPVREDLVDKTLCTARTDTRAHEITLRTQAMNDGNPRTTLPLFSTVSNTKVSHTALRTD